MMDSQERQDEGRPAGRTPGEQAPGGRSGEGAASAMEQLMSQNRQREQEGGAAGESQAR